MTIKHDNRFPSVCTIELGADEFLLRERFDSDSDEVFIDVYDPSNIYVGEIRDTNFEDKEAVEKFKIGVEEFLKENYY